MEMIQASQGYIQDDGLFVLQNSALVKPPINRLLTITWEETENSTAYKLKTDPQRRLDAIRAFMSDTSGEDELSAEDFAELESGKYRFNIGERTIDL